MSFRKDHVFTSKFLAIQTLSSNGWITVKKYIQTQSLQDSTIIEFSAEYRLGHDSVEFPDLAQKITEKQTFHGIGEIFHFLSAEFPFSECRILAGLFRAPLQFLTAKLAFSDRRISIFEHRISIFSA